MIKLKIKMAIILLLSIFILTSSYTVYATEHDIIILHTNDIHCNVKGNVSLSKIAWLKKNELQKTPNVLLVDAGDAIQGAPLGKLSRGEAIVNIMNQVGYDFCIPGNHEFDYGMERFIELLDKQIAGYYSANIIDINSKQPLLPAYKIFDCEDRKIALIGVTTPETLRSSNPKFFQDASGAFAFNFFEDMSGEKLYYKMQSIVNEVKRIGADYIFIVAHLGVNNVPQKWSSIELAKNLNGIDAIIDGHSHEKVNRIINNKDGENVLVIQTGSKLDCIGEIVITPGGKIQSKLIPNIDGEDDNIKTLISREIAAYEPLLVLPIGEARVNLYSHAPQNNERLIRKQECNLGNFVADAYRHVLDCDVAIANGGGIRNGITKGVITYNDLINAIPFGNMCSVIEVTGQQLLDALELGVKNYPEEHGGFLQVSGISYSINSNIDSSVILNDKGEFIKVGGEYRINNVTVHNKPLDLKRKYTLGGIDYILRDSGNGMTMFKGAYIVKDAIISDHEAVMEYLQNHLNGVIACDYENPYGEGRIKIE